ncbi:MAG: hypothetical protein QOH26_1759, partial [Actinomycetota bacterium]|nr:hypothetical protein [Actinomycetota bacterium]
RYLTIALPGLILCVAVGVTKIGPRWLSIAVFITVFALSAASLNRWYEHPPEYKDGPWREASTFLLSKVHDGDTVLFDSEASAILFNYYSRSLPDEPLRLEFPYLPPVLNDGESASLPVAGVGALKEQTPLPRRVWVLLGGTFMPTSGRFLSEGMGDRYRPGGIGIAFSYARMQLYRKTRPSHHERTR